MFYYQGKKARNEKKTFINIHSFILSFFPGHCWTVLNSFVNKEKKAPRTSTTNDSKWWPHSHTHTQSWNHECEWIMGTETKTTNKMETNKQEKKILQFYHSRRMYRLYRITKQNKKKCIESRNSGRNSEKKIRNKHDDEYPGSSII